jgi:hypothetical protein
MKKKFILIVSLILVISLLTGCDKTQEDIKLDEEIEVNEIEVENKGVKVEYPVEYEEDIFGDLSKEEINEIVDEIFEKISKSDKYKENIDLAIEEVFKEYGITDENNLQVAKDKIIISFKK